MSNELVTCVEIFNEYQFDIYVEHKISHKVQKLGKLSNTLISIKKDEKEIFCFTPTSVGNFLSTVLSIMPAKNSFKHRTVKSVTLMIINVYTEHGLLDDESYDALNDYFMETFGEPLPNVEVEEIEEEEESVPTNNYVDIAKQLKIAEKKNELAESIIRSHSAPIAAPIPTKPALKVWRPLPDEEIQQRKYGAWVTEYVNPTTGKGLNCIAIKGNEEHIVIANYYNLDKLIHACQHNLVCRTKEHCKLYLCGQVHGDVKKMLRFIDHCNELLDSGDYEYEEVKGHITAGLLELNNEGRFKNLPCKITDVLSILENAQKLKKLWVDAKMFTKNK